MEHETVDYVVIGGGSAGSIVAGRLAQASAQVVVLEAGGSDQKLVVRIPATVGTAYKKAHWPYVTEPDASRNAVRDPRSVGRILGGGGSVNSMVFVRGHRADFDGWAKLGAVGWDYNAVLPCFKRLETWEFGANDFRGGDGPISVGVQTNQRVACMAWITAAHQSGYAGNPDYNGADGLEGVALSQVNQRRGLRSQSSLEYLRRLAPKKFLTIVTNATVHRILIEKGRAVGIEYRRGGALRRILVREEVVVTAGAFGSPKLLMLSGIGPRAELERVGIDVVAQSPGVGKNLHDHVMVRQPYHSKIRTINKRRPSDFVTGITSFVLQGKGLLTSSVVQAIAMHRTDPNLEAPDVQLQFADFVIVRKITSNGSVKMVLAPMEGFHVAGTYLTTRGRGQLRLRSASPDDPPIIEHELLADRDDLRGALASMEEVRRVMEQSAIAELTSGPFEAGTQCRSDADWERYTRSNASAPSHPVGTCKMGSDDLAVVDPELRVNGVAGLRVADSSVMPTVTRGNTNAPSMMIGERAVDFILA